jgi:hypothetical protein
MGVGVDQLTDRQPVGGLLGCDRGVLHDVLSASSFREGCDEVPAPLQSVDLGPRRRADGGNFIAA